MSVYLASNYGQKDFKTYQGFRAFLEKISIMFIMDLLRWAGPNDVHGTLSSGNYYIT